jgi:hypothetical protein
MIEGWPLGLGWLMLIGLVCLLAYVVLRERR